MTRLPALAFTALVLTAAPALAADGPATLLGTDGDWSSYSYSEGNGNKVCFIASPPKTAKGNYTQRGPIHAIFTHRPADNTRNTFSYKAGYEYSSKEDVVLQIDKQTFKLVPSGDTAWAPDQASDDAIADAFRKGSSMVVKGTSARGTATTDTFGLKGTGQAFARINKECGIK